MSSIPALRRQGRESLSSRLLSDPVLKRKAYLVECMKNPVKEKSTAVECLVSPVCSSHIDRSEK